MSIDLSVLQYQDDDDQSLEEEETNDNKQSNTPKQDNQIINNQLLITEQTKEIATPEERRKLIILLQYYLVEFPEKLKDFKNKSLENMEYDELINLKQDFDIILSHKNTVGISENIFLKGVSILEYISVNYTPLKLEGYTQMCNDRELLDDVKLVILQNMNLISTKPEQRIIFKMATNMLLLHNINSQKQDNHIIDNNNKLNININNINEKYKDL